MKDNRVSTTICLPKDLRNMARIKKVNISKVCSDALAVIISTPSEEQELLYKRNALNMEISVINDKLNELDKLKTIAHKKNQLQEFNDELKKVRVLRSKWLAKGETDLAWNTGLRNFAETFNLSWSDALAYADGRKGGNF